MKLHSAALSETEVWSITGTIYTYIVKKDRIHIDNVSSGTLTELPPNHCKGNFSNIYLVGFLSLHPPLLYIGSCRVLRGRSFCLDFETYHDESRLRGVLDKK